VVRLAHSDVSVLIEGETGVGKTFVARLIHESSRRAEAPLRVVNCSAIPESLIESHLFGHERGAFTGANSARVGVLEAAGVGTILLDEIGELSLASQAKLLHVLEDRAFERVGSNQRVTLRGRVLCATNRNLEDMMRAGQFRRDLLFRISVVRLRVPPLRVRGDDLLLLAKRLLADACQRTTRRVTGFTDESIDLIRAHSWPGNVRELRNAIEHAVALGDETWIAPGDFPPEIAGATPVADDPDLVRLPSPLAVLERRAIDASLRATNGNRQRAAALLGVTRQTLYNKLRLHKLHP
jgi:DNA-binding NtrC family response regulator